jgi:C-terminal processing protease CtpA/Prc
MFLFKHEMEQTKEQEKQTQIEQKGSETFDVTVIEQTLSEEITKEQPKNFYWGLGITVDYKTMNVVPYGDTLVYVVTTVYAGYCGESIGLQTGDSIYLIDGIPINDVNEIMGFEPKKLDLTVLKKNGSIINIKTERCKVWF